MTEIFKVESIEGKGFGCIALKNIKPGTLVIKEKPQCTFQGDPENRDFFIHIWNCFHAMSPEDKKEFLNLHQSQRAEDIVSMAGPDFKLMAKLTAICHSNGFTTGVHIKSARFNHSCRPNAENIFIEGAIEIRAVTKIKAGEEITIQYQWMKLSMQPKITRQRFLLSRWNFLCACNLCQEESDDPGDEYAKYHGDQVELTNLESMEQDVGNISKQIQLLKNMYKLAKDKKMSRNFMLTSIVKKGVFLAIAGFQMSKKTEDKENLEYFEREAKNFANVGDKFTKMLFGKPSIFFQCLQVSIQACLETYENNLELMKKSEFCVL